MDSEISLYYWLTFAIAKDAGADIKAADKRWTGLIPFRVSVKRYTGLYKTKKLAKESLFENFFQFLEF